MRGGECEMWGLVTRGAEPVGFFEHEGIQVLEAVSDYWSVVLERGPILMSGDGEGLGVRWMSDGCQMGVR